MVESPGFVGESCGGVPAGAPARDTNSLAEPFAMEFNKASGILIKVRQKNDWYYYTCIISLCIRI